MVTPDLRIQKQPVIEGSHVELRPAVVTPRYPRGLRFLSGVNVPTLLRCVQTRRAVPDILEAYQQHPRRAAEPAGPGPSGPGPAVSGGPAQADFARRKPIRLKRKLGLLRKR